MLMRRGLAACDEHGRPLRHSRHARRQPPTHRQRPSRVLARRASMRPKIAAGPRWSYPCPLTRNSKWNVRRPMSQSNLRPWRSPSLSPHPTPVQHPRHPLKLPFEPAGPFKAAGGISAIRRRTKKEAEGDCADTPHHHHTHNPTAWCLPTPHSLGELCNERLISPAPFFSTRFLVQP